MAVVVVNIAACLRIHSILIADLEAENVFVEVVVKGGGVHLNGVVSGRGVVRHTLSGTAQLPQSVGIVFQQFTYAVILGAISFPVVVQNVVVVSSVTLFFHVRLQCLPDIRGHQSIAGVVLATKDIISCNLLAVGDFFIGTGGGVLVFVQNDLSIVGGLNIILAEAAVVMIAGSYIILTVDQFHLGTGRHIGSRRLSGQVALRIKVLRQPTIFAVFLQCSIHQILHAAGRSVFIVLQLKVRIASIFLRQLLSVKAGDASFVGIAHVRGGNSQAVVLVHISMLGAVGQGDVKNRGAAGFLIKAHGAGGQRIDVSNTIMGVLHGFVAPHLGFFQRCFAFVRVKIAFAVLAHHFLHLAQLNGLVALGVLFDVEGDLEVAGVRVIGTAVVGVILGRLLRGLFRGLLGRFLRVFRGLFGLFLRGPLRAGTFLALFLRVRIAGAGGLLAGLALIFGVVLVLALDVVPVVLGGAGQGLDGLGLLRALNGGFVVRRCVVVAVGVTVTIGGLVGVVAGGSGRLVVLGRGLLLLRRGLALGGRGGGFGIVNQRDNGHLQAGAISIRGGVGSCSGTAHANRAAEHRKGQRHRNDLLLLGLFSHNRPPHFTRDCVPRTTFQKPIVQNRRPLGSPYNPILYTFSKNFKGVIARKKACAEISAD